MDKWFELWRFVATMLIGAAIVLMWQGNDLGLLIVSGVLIFDGTFSVIIGKKIGSRQARDYGVSAIAAGTFLIFLISLWS